MTITEGTIAGRAPRAARFATIKAMLKRQTRDLSRAHRRDAATELPTLHRDAPRGALQAGIEPLRLLQAVLDHADIIALDVPERGRVRQAHMLVTLPTWLLDRATVIAAYDTDDEDTDGGEKHQDLEPNLAGYETARGSGDLELDEADSEPSLGSCDGKMNQEHWADGDRLDRERGEKAGDCDDDEDSHDRESDTSDYEPEHEEPNLSPCGFGVGSTQNWGVIDGECGGYGRDKRDDAIRSRLKAHASMPVPIAGPPPARNVDVVPEIFLPTGNRPGGLIEMKNQTTGETGVWRLIHEAGKAVQS
jgi:hypothetical protein